jgi:hypothetical protein
VDALEGLFKWCKKHFPYKKSGSEIVIPYDTSSASQSQSSTEKKEDTAGSTSLTASAKSGQLQPSPQKQVLYWLTVKTKQLVAKFCLCLFVVDIIPDTTTTTASSSSGSKRTWRKVHEAGLR